MIPKIIHYCWLSDDPIPLDLQKYINGWTEKLPDYKIIKWDFSIFPKGTSSWVDQAFKRKKYAFAADYIRLYALYHYGGIYLDSDVEVLKSFDEFLCLDDMICYENSSRKGLEVAAFGVSKNREWIKLCLDYYSHRNFEICDGIFDTKVMPEVVKEVLAQNNWTLYNVKDIKEAVSKDSTTGITVFPYEYFSPKSYETGKQQRTIHTYCIHHFAASWHGPKEKIYQIVGKIIGKNNAKSLADWIKKSYLALRH